MTDETLAQLVTKADLELALADSNLELVTWITKWIMVTMGVALTGLFAALVR